MYYCRMRASHRRTASSINDMSAFNLLNAIVPVTGAASGIGLAVCKRLRAEGATPLLLDVHAHRLDAALQEVFGAAAARNRAYLLDVRDPQAVDACLKRIGDDHGPVTHAVA